MDRKIFGVPKQNHDGGICEVSNDAVACVRLSERYTGFKHERHIGDFVQQLEELNEPWKLYLSCLYEHDKVSITTSWHEHHLLHAYCGFYSSDFNDALCIIIDGYGCHTDEGAEVMSVYSFKDNKFDSEVDKVYEDTHVAGSPARWIENTKSIGREYAKMCEEFELARVGQGDFAAGKLMGLAQYKGFEDKLPEKYATQEWLDRVDRASQLQKASEQKVIDIIQKYVDETGIKNVVLSGGVFLNCVINYKILKNLDINLHIDPVPSDKGICIGTALKGYEDYTGNTPPRFKDVYLGQKWDVNLDGWETSEVGYGDIINLIEQGEIVALYQGRSEVGDRALGNRSLLYDPRLTKDDLNEYKRRESFRPFAATVLKEHAADWFDVDESPFMTYAVDVHPDKVDQIPAVVHADNTCRVQTVTQQQNIHFYNLIQEFYKRTGVPMLLNTSYNIAGYPMVESPEDALTVLKHTRLKYLYFPELNTLVTHHS